MLVYFLSFFLSIYLMWYGEKHKISFCFLLSVLTLTVLGGIRYGIGTDFFSYKQIYDEYGFYGTTAGHYIEFLFCQLMRLCIFLNLRFTVFVFLLQAMTNGITFLAIYRKRKDIGVFFPWAIYCFEYYLLSYNLIRQSIAMAFCLLAITYFRENKIKFIILTAIAVGFHNSAIVFIPILFLSQIYKSPKRSFMYFFIIIASLVFVIKKNLIISLVARVFPVIGYAGYLMGTGSSSVFGILFKFLPVLVPFLFILHKISNNQEYDLYFVLFILGGVLSLLVLSGNEQIGRITFYYTMLKIFIIPYSVKCYSIKYNRYVIIPFTFLWSFFMFIWDYLILNNGQSVPYQSFLWGNY